MSDRLSFATEEDLEELAATLTPDKIAALSANIAPSALTEVAREWLSHPYAQRYIQRSSTGDNRIMSPADVLGERYVRLASLFGALVFDELEANLSEGLDVALVAMCKAAFDSPPYLWSQEVITGIAESGTVPRHVLSPSILPSPFMWWTFESSLEIRGVDSEDAICDNIFICDAIKGIQVTLIGENGVGEERRPLIQWTQFKYGDTFPDDFGEQHLAAAESILSFLAFLNSPYIPKETRRPIRQERRAVYRAGADQPDDVVTFVVLRRPQQKRSSNDDAETIDWKHRWIVSGHYRSQWYPTEQAHHVIWIAPYVKGPEDKPMLTHAYKVAR